MNTISKHMAYYLLLAAVGLFVFIMLSGHAQAAETAQVASQTLTDSLVDIIQQVSGGVKQGVSFLQQEIPDVIKQLLMWKMAESLVVFLLCVLVIAIWIKLMFMAEKHDAKNYLNDSMFPTAMFGGFVALIAAGVAVSCLLTAMQIYIAPKVWLIEYAASLVK